MNTQTKSQRIDAIKPTDYEFEQLGEKHCQLIYGDRFTGEYRFFYASEELAKLCGKNSFDKTYGEVSRLLGEHLFTQRRIDEIRDGYRQMGAKTSRQCPHNNLWYALSMLSTEELPIELASNKGYLTKEMADQAAIQFYLDNPACEALSSVKSADTSRPFVDMCREIAKECPDDKARMEKYNREMLALLKKEIER